jgi:hypothetical protein
MTPVPAFDNPVQLYQNYSESISAQLLDNSKPYDERFSLITQMMLAAGAVIQNEHEAFIELQNSRKDLRKKTEEQADTISLLSNSISVLKYDIREIKSNIIITENENRGLINKYITKVNENRVVTKKNHFFGE